MKKPAVGKTDNLRALTDDPELRALMEQYYAVKPREREPYGAFWKVTIAENRTRLPAIGER